ncbi:hypothetical protein FA13DRAFT_1809239 [Coprinellus micaceus]|uniref:Uncharacterized protein n=1 Tax=Coprinellus micaceus TaxID=71717 RepID=A0A4Y7TVA8_COPMI|nr:hypothetical protein FA13DRAFT_1809239 [Coprinellus micaceus]
MPTQTILAAQHPKTIAAKATTQKATVDSQPQRVGQMSLDGNNAPAKRLRGGCVPCPNGICCIAIPCFIETDTIH